MRPILDMDTVQIEVTNACHNKCSNCTRLVGHHKKPYMMDFGDFKIAVDSMAAYPKMTGVMGGEPLLHPQFEEFCIYLGSKIPPERTGLWTCFPVGYEHHREIIVKTFGNIFLNDQSRGDILHAPVLVSSQELPLEQWYKDYLIDHCWVQNSWSASINPHGAFFCEIAGALSMLVSEEPDGWEVALGWWTRSPKNFVEQMEKYCTLCGCAMPLKKRYSVEGDDDVSRFWLNKLRESPKIKAGKYKIHDLKIEPDQRQCATYKDPVYRDAIAKRYGMFLTINERGFQTPHLFRKFDTEGSE